MPNEQKDQPGSDSYKEREPEDEDELEDEVRRIAERQGGVNDNGRPVTPAEVEKGVTEEESRLVEERGERGWSPDDDDE
jgi:hypothetical protein